jgi:hypothetical protein
VQTDGTSLPRNEIDDFGNVADFWAALGQAKRLTVRKTYTP